MKKLTLVATLVAVLAMSAFALSLGAQTSTPHAQLSSAIDQQPDADGEVFSLELVDSTAGMALTPTTITVLDPGLYLTVFVPQVTSEKGKSRCYTAWSRLNGVNVPNSNIEWCSQAGNYNTLVQTQQAVACYAAGDVIQFVHAASEEGIFADAITHPGQPLVPSAITTVVKVGDC